MKTFACILLLLSSLAAFPQLVEVPLGGAANVGSSKTFSSARIQATTLNLPFWDDFSESDNITYPTPTLWEFSQSVFLNNGIGIRPPTKNVVTLDGADSIGKPYNVNDVLAKGYADKLVSHPIRMDLVDPGIRSTVYLSFYFQVKGRGESPDNGDVLNVDFKKADGSWVNVFSQENNSTLLPDTFTQIILPVTASEYFHDDFQFRIRNFARLSGPYDSWNVDYIYLNSGRSPSDTSYPDRAVSSSLSSLFIDYYAIPIRHFMENPASNLTKPAVELFNLKSGNLQPFDYTTEAKITTTVGSSTSSTILPLDVAQDPGAILTGLQYFNLTLNKIPPVSSLNPLAKSIEISLTYGMSTKDNVLPAQNGDYDPAKYSPIDFRTNDTIQTNYVLSNYYAYDDGSAEYGAGLNQAGSYLAFHYIMKSALTDTLTNVDIYFPEFGDNTSQSLLFQVRKDLSDASSSILFQQPIVVNRTTQNKFVRYKLDQYILVNGDFYVGWKQLSSASIPVGLDKNNDHGDKVYYNITGTWVQNSLVKGSMMVRPVFGNADVSGVTTATETTRADPLYPNPTTGLCYLPAGAENISAFDITGRKVEALPADFGDQKAIILKVENSGLVVVRFFLNGKPQAQKIMVRVE